MDKNPEMIDEKKKNLINKITGILIDEMTQKKVNQELGQEIATYILSESNNIVDDNTFNDFVKKLSERYSIFRLYHVNMSLENQMKKTDEEKISDIKEQLSKLASLTN